MKTLQQIRDALPAALDHIAALTAKLAAAETLASAATVACTFDCSRHHPAGGEWKRDLGCNVCLAFGSLEKALAAYRSAPR